MDRPPGLPVELCHRFPGSILFIVPASSWWPDGLPGTYSKSQPRNDYECRVGRGKCAFSILKHSKQDRPNRVHAATLLIYA
jgi:hypothetical protein